MWRIHAQLRIGQCLLGLTGGLPYVGISTGFLLVRLRLATGGVCGSDLHYYHNGGFGAVRLREPMILGHEVSAFIEDCEARGLAEKILLVCCGEMGRTPALNKDGGRDHWPNCWSLALAGGGIKTGQAIGTSDEKGANVTSRVVSMGDLYATVYKLMGVDWTKEIMSPIGRPIKIANSLEDKTGDPIPELLS